MMLTLKQVDLDSLAVPDTLQQTYCLVNVVHKEKVDQDFKNDSCSSKTNIPPSTCMSYFSQKPT